MLLASELEESKSCYPIAYHLVQTFVSHTLTRLIPQHPMVSVPVHPTSRPATGSGGNSSSQQQQQQQESLFVLLLGSDGWERDVRYDSSKHHGPANLPLSAAGGPLLFLMCYSTLFISYILIESIEQRSIHRFRRDPSELTYPHRRSGSPHPNFPRKSTTSHSRETESTH